MFYGDRKRPQPKRWPNNKTVHNKLGQLQGHQKAKTKSLVLWREVLGADAAWQSLSLTLAATGQEVPSTLATCFVVGVSLPLTKPGHQLSRVANQSVPQLGPAEPIVSLSQPPVDTAVAAVASGHLARRAPHPSAKTASGTFFSPRKPALKTVPPGQMPAREATLVKPAPPSAAVPSSPPVVDLNPGGPRGTHLIEHGLSLISSSQSGMPQKTAKAEKWSGKRGPSFGGAQTWFPLATMWILVWNGH